MVDVELEQGVLGGSEVDGLAVFRGVPYAVAERFAEPAPVPAWSGVRDATAPALLAPQLPSRLARAVGPQPDQDQSEDCLSVNVWAPSPMAEQRPVVLFVHGGGFLTGGGGVPWYDGARLARAGDVVVVTVSYRLGYLGWGHVDGAVPNRGLRDVAAALRWVHTNVAAFGGDPARITATGQSAGALMILTLLAGDHLDGIVQRAVLQSAPAGMPPQSDEIVGEAAALMADALAGPDPRAASVDDLIAAQGQATTTFARRHPGAAPPFHLRPEPGLVPADIPAAVSERGVGIPLLVGTTTDEGTAFVEDRATADRMTEELFEPSHALAERLGAAHYRLAWRVPGNPLGATHCMELPFLFGTLDDWAAAPMLAGADRAELERMVRLVQSTWLGFARGEELSPSPIRLR